MSEKKFSSYRELSASSHLENEKAEVVIADEKDAADTAVADIDGEITPEKLKAAQEFFKSKENQAAVIGTMREWVLNLDVSDEEWAQEVRNFMDKQDLSVTDRDFFEGLIEKYQTRQARVLDRCDVIWDYLVAQGKAGDLKEFDYKMSEYLFGFRPTGAVEVEILPTAVFVKFYNGKDFDLAYEGEDNYGVNPGPRPHQHCLGFKTYSRLAGFDAIAEYAAPEIKQDREVYGTRYHEEGHSLNSSIFNLDGKTISFRERREFLSKSSAEVIEEHLDRIVAEYAAFAYWQAINELLAVVRGGDFGDYSRGKALTTKGGFYDYYGYPDLGYKSIVLEPILENKSLPADNLTHITAELESRFQVSHREHLVKVGKLVDLVGHIQHYLQLNDLELYSWLVVEAAQCSSVDDLEEHWQKLDDTARIAYMAARASSLVSEGEDNRGRQAA